MRHWHLIGNRCEVAKDGDFIQLAVGPGRERIAVTNIGGALFAWDGRCPHRGAFIYGEGWFGTAAPRCAYHGLRVDAANARTYELATIGDWILVSQHPQKAPHSAPEGIWDMLRDTPTLRLHSWHWLDMACDWRVAVENALDSEHVAHVHESSLAMLGIEPTVLHCYAGGSSREDFSVRNGLRRLAPFFERQPLPGYTHAHLYPYSAISSTCGFTYSLQHYLPRADGKTLFLHRLYAAPTTRDMEPYFKGVQAINQKVFSEDAVICANVPPGDYGRLGTHERRIAHFRGVTYKADAGEWA